VGIKKSYRKSQHKRKEIDMNAFSKYIEIGYLLVGLIFIIDGCLSFQEGTEIAFLRIGLGILATFMFFFKRRFRKKRS
jgi:hypothetical protein